MKDARKTLLFLFVAATIFSGCQAISVDFGTAGNQHPAENPANSDASSPDEEFSLVPVGVLVNKGDENSLTYVDATGQVVGAISAPGLGATEPDDAVIAGRVVSAEPLPPVVFRAWTPEQSLMANINSTISTLRPSNTFLSMAASPDGALAFSEVLMTEDNTPQGYLFAGTVDTIGSVGSFYDLVDAPNYMVVTPVAVESTEGEPQGVYYTKTAWGIGGVDLIFPINRGLYFFDLTSGGNTVSISDDHGFQGISPDMRLAGYVDYDLNGDRSMTIRAIQSGTDVKIPLAPDSDRGAGYVAFSPDNRRAAWLEASGSMISEPYDFHPIVRIGDAGSGEVLQGLDDGMASAAINASRITFMRPAGWLTNETLLVEVRGEDWKDVNLLLFSVSTNALSVFTEGSFIGFAY